VNGNKCLIIGDIEGNSWKREYYDQVGNCGHCVNNSGLFAAFV
jgi:hypothetical protein